ncbi:MAG TPA: Hpt domain-containing protein [Candidatus Synoicihabitans sp.]|nr:Hpt domain-containing protein [Candidatus Synoicihabitans sp.]
MSDLPILDAESIENLRALGMDGDDSFLREIIGIFVEDTPNRLNEMRQAFAANDQATFTRAAHSIKGSASNLGAFRLRALAEKLEHDSKKFTLAGLDAHLPVMEAEFAAAKIELEKL